MIVTCPNCTTRLQLDKDKVPVRPFSVRCPKCQQIINAQPPTAAPQRAALAAVGGLPASNRSPQEASAAAVPQEQAAGVAAPPSGPPAGDGEAPRGRAAPARAAAAERGAA